MSSPLHQVQESLGIWGKRSVLCLHRCGLFHSCSFQMLQAWPASSSAVEKATGVSVDVMGQNLFPSKSAVIWAGGHGLLCRALLSGVGGPVAVSVPGSPCEVSSLHVCPCPEGLSSAVSGQPGEPQCWGRSSRCAGLLSFHCLHPNPETSLWPEA